MSTLVRDASGTPAQFLQPIAAEVVYASYTASAAQTSAIGADKDGKTKRLCIITATSAAWFLWGTNPTAQVGAGGSVFISAGAYFYIELDAGDKVSFIRNAADGVGVVIPTR